MNLECLLLHVLGIHRIYSFDLHWIATEMLRSQAMYAERTRASAVLLAIASILTRLRQQRQGYTKRHYTIQSKWLNLEKYPISIMDTHDVM